MTIQATNPNLSRRALLLSAIGTTALASCAPGSGSSAPASAQPVPTLSDVASLGPVTLKVWDQETRGGQQEQFSALINAFMTKYPNVKIERTSRSFDDLKKTVGLALSGNDVPDVVQVNNARADMGVFVRDGQLLNLDSYARELKWTTRFPESVLSRTRYSPDAKTFGAGSLYGLPQVGEIVGIFYSKSRLSQIGGNPPKTWDEYLALLERASQAGLQPMMLGNLQKWPALHVFGPLQAHFVPADEVVKLGMGNPGASWLSAGNVKAMEAFKSWADKKYFGPSPNGLDYDPAVAEFGRGTAVFLPGGSWLASEVNKTMAGDIGFFAPPPGIDGKLATTGGTGIPFAVPTRARNISVAVAFIDFITSDEAMNTLASTGNMPILKTRELAPSSGVDKEIFDSFEELTTTGSMLPYLDYATPTFADTIGNALQELIGGTATPAQVLERLEADYRKATE